MSPRKFSDPMLEQGDAAEALLAVLDAFEKLTTVNTALTKLKKAHLDADSAREVIDHLTMGRFPEPA